MMNSLLLATPIIAITLLVVVLGIFAVKMFERELRNKNHSQHRRNG